MLLVGVVLATYIGAGTTLQNVLAPGSIQLPPVAAMGLAVRESAHEIQHGLVNDLRSFGTQRSPAVAAAPSSGAAASSSGAGVSKTISRRTAAVTMEISAQSIQAILPLLTQPVPQIVDAVVRYSEGVRAKRNAESESPKARGLKSRINKGNRGQSDGSSNTSGIDNSEKDSSNRRGHDDSSNENSKGSKSHKTN